MRFFPYLLFLSVLFLAAPGAAADSPEPPLPEVSLKGSVRTNVSGPPLQAEAGRGKVNPERRTGQLQMDTGRGMVNRQLQADTAGNLQGPRPTDTSRNKVNAFLAEFYEQYQTDFESLAIPREKPRIARQVPEQDHRLRPVREAWTLLIPAILLILSGILFRYYRRELGEFLEGLASNRLMGQRVREPGLLNNPVVLLFLLMGCLAIGAVLYFLIPPSMLPFVSRGPESYLLLSGLAVLAYLLRILLLKITSLIFQVDEMVNSYLYILYSATGSLAFLITIFLLFHLLGPPQFSGLAVPALQTILLLFFAYQYARGCWYLVRSFQFPRIYLILYLCAFEICPLLILGMGLLKS